MLTNRELRSPHTAPASPLTSPPPTARPCLRDPGGTLGVAPYCGVLYVSARTHRGMHPRTDARTHVRQTIESPANSANREKGEEREKKGRGKGKNLSPSLKHMISGAGNRVTVHVCTACVRTHTWEHACVSERTHWRRHTYEDTYRSLCLHSVQTQRTRLSLSHTQRTCEPDQMKTCVCTSRE